ncbi:MAG: PTS sugar transporter subunit IIC [Gemmatimonadaceae bacterium]|jgi:mannose/fructose/N-acetylgalactosamine-specific phosphotransferase system component IIC|nr:PTS sugar transporter subunit IIC [Gemmatimonadaceae bacterium]MCC6429661.1 PTS sugar transporter subunit IIC [Gemmatimonadaceae bacterium]
MVTSLADILGQQLPLLLPQLLPLAMLAGLLGLDVVSFPQAMISRPIVAATLAGAFLGAPVAGLMCGAALECLALEALPVGASRYPEWGSASVVAGAVSTLGVQGGALPRPGAFAVSVLVGIVTAWIGGTSMIKHRQLIASFARPRLGQLAEGNRRTVIGLQVFGMTADLARGAVLGVAAYVPAALLAAWCDARWSVDAALTRAIVVTAVAAVAATAVWKDFHAISGTRRLFLLSLSVGTILVVIGA